MRPPASADDACDKRPGQVNPLSLVRYKANDYSVPFEEWTEVFGSECHAGALLDRVTHHVHILEMYGESNRLKQSRSRQGA